MRGSTIGARILTVGSAPATSIVCKPFELLALRAGARGRAGPGPVLVDERFELAALGDDGRVDALVVLAPLALIFQKRVDRAGIQRQLAARQFERLAARGAQEGPIVRDDQAGLAKLAQKVLEQNLRAQVEKVRRLVEQQQVRLVQQQRRQLDARLPAAGELLDRPFEIGPLELELAGHFAALPVGLAAVAHQKLEHRLAGQERIVLPQVAQPQLRMANDLAAVQLLVAQQHAAERRLAGAVAADEADLVRVGRASPRRRPAAPGGRSSCERRRVAAELPWSR